MPKKVDHDARRTAIAEAVWRLMADGGLEGVTMRLVATEADMSLGQVQHYFASKDELLAFAHELIADRAAARVATRAHPPAEEERGPQELVRDLLVEMLPLDEQRRLEAQATLTYLARAAVQPEAAMRVEKTDGERMSVILAQLTRGQRDGTVALGLDLLGQAATLLAMVDGLVAHCVIGLLHPATAERALDEYLDGLFSADRNW